MSFIDAEFIQHLLTTYGYLAVFTIVLLESGGIPLPGETALILAAGYAGTRHTMDIRIVIAAAASGAILGDNIGFWIGRRLGRKLLLKCGQYIGIGQQKFDLAEYLYMRHGGKIIFFGRFVAVLRALAAVFAGVYHFPPTRFFIYNAADRLGHAFRLRRILTLRKHAPDRWSNAVDGVHDPAFGRTGALAPFQKNEDRLFDDAKRALESRKRSGPKVQRARR